MSTLQRLNEVFQDLFEDDEIDINPTMTAADIEGWDSLMHVALIVETEKIFDVRFSSGEVAALKTIGDLVDQIDRHQTGS